MKVVINACYGGYSLSPKAVKRLAELNGRECYFFGHPRNPVDLDRYVPLTLEEAEKSSLFFTAFDTKEIPYPLPNKFYSEHNLDTRPEPRTDPKLIQVIEELGAGHRTGASGHCAELKIVEIPDGTDYEIEEYDGFEHIAEVHRTWG